MSTGLTVDVYCDGGEPPPLPDIIAAWTAAWSRHYEQSARLTVRDPINLKIAENRSLIPAGLTRIERIRNPDVFFVESSKCAELGGIEITDHSPDGSNIEKRYPFLWAAPGSRVNAFVATRYLKRRPGGQINRLPQRHIERNQQFLRAWDPTAPEAILRQFVPIRELHMGDLVHVPAELRAQLLTWRDLGELFAHLLAARCLAGGSQLDALNRLHGWKEKLTALAAECHRLADHRAEASTLLKGEGRWIQVYNARPDSGHWERGEGQFDSIDGRLMFTLDEIAFLPPSQRPERMEFWLPQMVSQHPWIAEQKARGFGSKRLRNILVELAPLCPTKFAEDLTQADWGLLRQNSRLLLERKDWEPGLYSVRSCAAGHAARTIARAGLPRAPRTLLDAIERMLQDPNLFYCAHRAYVADWNTRCASELAALPRGAVVLAPRLPARLLAAVAVPTGVHLVSAEACTREQLLMLRQLHRHKF